jgi:hypothetical protein
MGDSSSNWEGIQYANSAAAMTASVDCLPLSATNAVFANSDTSNYDNDSTFKGILVYDATNP